MSQEFDNNVLDLVQLKGLYPYGYLSNFENSKEEFPSKEKFYSSLTNRKITDKQYQHVLNVWNKTEMKMIKDYHDLQLKCNVLLLDDVFDKFRNNGLHNYGLCPIHYVSIPSLSYDAMFKMTNIEIELFPDPNMYIFFEKGAKGGISYILNRCGKANNKYLKCYELKEEPKNLIYLGADNL